MITKYLKKTLITNIITKCFKKKKKKRSCCCESESESAEKVASIDDLITEILLHLPGSSLLRFKSVSKHWLSLITSPHFSRLHVRRHQFRPSGVYIPFDEMHPHPQYRYIPLNSNSEQPCTIKFRTITRSGNGKVIRILQSCNGLLFCTNSKNGGLCKYYVYNPTTRKVTTIPLPLLLFPLLNVKLVMFTYCTTLAFDPLRSPHYKLVFAHSIGSYKYEMVIYSSETQLWKVCGDQPLNMPYRGNFWNGVYLNGTVYYMNFSHTSSVCLKIDEERIETMPMPLIPDNKRYIYFGQSGGRLHLITTTGLVFDVYEMEKDCSKWCVRYQVDLRGEVYYGIIDKIMGIVHGEREEDSFLVFKTIVDGFIRLMKYKFADKTLKLLRGRGAGQTITAHNINSIRPMTFEFIQSLSPV